MHCGDWRLLSGRMELGMAEGGRTAGLERLQPEIDVSLHANTAGTR